MISERTIRTWRTESLVSKNLTVVPKKELQLHDRILRLTQDLLDIKMVSKHMVKAGQYDVSVETGEVKNVR